MRILLFLSAFVLGSGCARQNAQEGVRIVSLSPAITEIIYAIGAEDKLFGITNHCSWPPEALKTKDSVGDFSFPSIEKITEIQPSLILAAGDGQGKALSRLTNLGYDVRIFQPADIDELFAQITETGRLTGKEKNAAQLVKRMNREMSSIPRIKNKSIFIAVCSKPLICASDKTFLSAVCKKIGFKNISVFKNSYPGVNAEWLMLQKPDYILLTGSSEKEFRALYPYIKKSKIICPENIDMIVRPGPRITRGMMEIYYLAKDAAKKNAE
ncbi:MAG: helical backbone metal receptor [Elusimicrobiota bacterium]|nr:helical backbone metal receptor [Elusimicrobiota bacterium]